MKRYAILPALLLLILLSPTAIAAGCLLGEEKELDIAANQTNPDIYENTIVYQDSRNGNSDIYMYDLLTLAETRVTSEAANQQAPAIFGNTLVWADYRNGNWDIYKCDLSKNGSAGGCLATDAKIAVTTESATQHAPAIYSTKIVWYDRRNSSQDDIYMCDLALNGTAGGCLATDAKTRITSSPIGEVYADIYESKIVWHTIGTDSNVLMCDLTLNGFPGGCGETDQKTPIVTALGSQVVAQIHGNNITWQDTRNLNKDIYRYDLTTSTEYRVTSEPQDQNSPAIYGTKIVWADGRNDSADIYMCDLALNGSPGGCLETDAKTRVTSATGSQKEPAIYKDNVVWQDDRAAGAWDIYLNPLACNGLSNRVAWYKWNDAPTYAVSWADDDSDGDMDLAVGHSPLENYLYPNYTTGLSTIEKWNDNALDDTRALAWGDTDKDGYLELAVGNVGPEKVYDGTITGLTTNLIFNTGTTEWTTSIAFADVDNDGDLDLAIGNGGPPNVIYENADGNLISNILWSDDVNNNTAAIAFADVDNDGDLDLAIGNSGGSNSYLYTNNGAGNFTQTWNGSLATALAFGDVDNDGYAELVLGYYGQTYLYDNVYGVLSATPIWSDGDTNNKTESLSFADIDNDGDLDLALGRSGQTNRVYENVNGALTTNIIWNDLSNEYTNSISFADVNNDGDLELAVGNGIYRDDKVYQNVSAEVGNPNLAPTAPATESLTANYSCRAHKISLAWDEGTDDKTPVQSLYYNIRVSTTTGANDIVSGAYGQSGESAYYGNGMLANFRGVRNKPNLGYYWAVQSIDGGLRASPWSIEQYLAPDAPPIIGSATFDINEDAGFVDNLIDLWAYTDDNSTADLNIVYSITLQSASGIVNCVLDQNRYIDCTTVPDQNGYSDIGVSVMDECDQTDETTFRVNVLSVNDAPTAQITSPANGSTVEDVNTTFTGTATDPEDGNLSGASLVWSSSIDGALGAGSSITPALLSPGTHTITLTATDSGNLEDTAGITVNVCVLPRDDLVITQNTTLCSSPHYAPDAGNDGAIVIEGNNLTLDCDNANIYGDGAGKGIVVNGYIPAEWYVDSNTERGLDANKIMANEAGFEASIVPYAGITLQNCELSGYEHGVVITGGDGITMQNVAAHGNAGAGIGFQGVRNSTIKNNTVYNNAKGGIAVVVGRNNVIELNEAYGNGGTGIASAGRADIIRNNNVHDNESGIGIAGADMQIRDNTVLNNNTTENSTGIGALFSSNAQIVQNLVQNSQFGIRLLSSYGAYVADNNVQNSATGVDIGAWLFTAGDMNSGTFERNRVLNSTKAGMHMTDGVFGIGNKFEIHNLVLQGNYFENPGVWDLHLDDKGTSYLWGVRVGGGESIHDSNVFANSFMGGGVQAAENMNNFCVEGVRNIYGTGAQHAPGECMMISGNVSQAPEGLPLAGATVVAKTLAGIQVGTTGTTDEAGNYAVYIPGIAGFYKITATYGMQSSDKIQNISGDIIVNFVMPALP